MSTKTKELILKISGCIYFVFSIFKILEVINLSTTSFMFLIDDNRLFWGLFYIFVSILYILFFTYSVSSAYIFAASFNTFEWKQTGFFANIYSLFFLVMYTTTQVITGFSKEEIIYCLIMIFIGIIYQLIIFLLLKKDVNISIKNLFSYNNETKKCLRINLIFLAIILLGCFIYANIKLQN